MSVEEFVIDVLEAEEATSEDIVAARKSAQSRFRTIVRYAFSRLLGVLNEVTEVYHVRLPSHETEPEVGEEAWTNLTSIFVLWRVA